MKKRDYILTATLIILSAYTTIAQSVGSDWGDKKDLLVVNRDRSNHWGQLRLQTSNRGVTLSNYKDRFAVQFVTSNDYKNFGTERFTVRNSGNVGLNGVTNPLGELQFKNTINNRKLVLWHSSNNNAHQFYGLGINSNTLRYQSEANHVFYSTINSSSSRENLRINKDGKVGLGVSNPEQNLHVKDNALISNTFLGKVGDSNSWAGLAHKDQVGTDTYAMITQNNGKHTLINKKNTGDGYIGFRVGNANKMVIDNSGRVGIGTHEPKGELHLSKSTKNRKIVLYEASNNDHNFYGFGVNSATLRYQSGQNHVFYSYVSPTSSKEVFRINKNGTVKIGNTNLAPDTVDTSLLSVSGGLRTNKVVLNIGTFPDYVFDKNYDLMPLEKVAEYINENKHLPNIPSEKEIVASGLDMNMITTKLVEKVEELTLYTIDQEDKIKAQNKLIESLVKRLERLENKEQK
ncbi:hypothetical protein [Tenacibaculum jejuense]|uniref:Peptidase S74 domain-containing protein n=1 Tax=Tenacibaculum jejuense TaxID=584609 RepID=A0A238U7Z0_9FLAO|nr:hypothetical protein [Tenacibaculum jejuense]SNR15301.1 Protein of unknown function precursor [Tenacibaculum jejuense]